MKNKAKGYTTTTQRELTSAISLLNLTNPQEKPSGGIKKYSSVFWIWLWSTPWLYIESLVGKWYKVKSNWSLCTAYYRKESTEGGGTLSPLLSLFLLLLLMLQPSTTCQRTHLSAGENEPSARGQRGSERRPGSCVGSAGFPCALPLASGIFTTPKRLPKNAHFMSTQKYKYNCKYLYS